MSTGVQILFGVAIAVVLFGGWLAARRRPAGRRPVPPDLDARRRDDDRLRALLAEGEKIQAVKELREQTGMGLVEAKAYVDALEATGEPPAPPAGDVPEETVARARALVAEGRRIHAVKAVREATGWGLARAKDFVDGLQPPGS